MADLPTNGRNMTSFELPLADALMMMEAMRLAGNAAMMSPLPDAEKRLREYEARFAAMVPAAARHFDGEVLCEINIALADAKFFEIAIEESRYSYRYPRKGRVVITVGNRQWVSQSAAIQKDGEEFNAIITLLEDLAPMDCRRKSADTDPQSS